MLLLAIFISINRLLRDVDEDTLLAMLEHASEQYAFGVSAKTDGDTCSAMQYFQQAAQDFDEAGGQYSSIAQQARVHAERAQATGTTQDAHAAYEQAAVQYQRSCRAYLQAYHSLSQLNTLVRPQSLLGSLEILCRVLKTLQKHGNVARAFTESAARRMMLGLNAMKNAAPQSHP